MEFQTLNNETEYEELLIEFKATQSMGITWAILYSDFPTCDTINKL